MSSPADDATGPGADLGLLSPVSAGTAAEELTGDAAVVRAMVRVEAALLHALVDAEVAPASVEATAHAVAAARPDPRTLALAAVEGGNPVIPLVHLLREAAGPDGAEWVHHGATSQDVLDTALVLVAADVCHRVEADLTDLAGTLARLADETRAVPAVARTLTQQALPTTLGFRAAGWLAGVHDAVRAVRSCRATLPVSLGGAVGTTPSYDGRGAAVVEACAARLDLRAPVLSWHTRRTAVLEVAHAMQLVAAACGKVAADLLVMAQTEVGEAREAVGGASSAMPHKANPAQSVLVASAARQVPALASVLGGSAVAEQERPAGAWHAEWQPLRELLRLAGAAAERTAVLLPGVRFDEAALQRNHDTLVAATGHDAAWVRERTADVDAWVDRVLTAHEEVFA